MRTLALVLSLFLASAAHAQTADSTLTLTRNGCRFSFPLPKGWVADSAHAKDYQADIVLYKEAIGLGIDKPTIAVGCFKADPQNQSMENHPAG